MNHCETELRESLDKYRIPEHMHDCVIRYVFTGIEPGHFLTALLSNDLKETFNRADAENALAIRQWVLWLYNEAPAPCWGSPEKVREWIEQRRLTEQLEASCKQQGIEARS